eukprot:scaffold7525_cov248-Pinguiococcus_pyrenoidosus.AAC.7
MSEARVRSNMRDCVRIRQPHQAESTTSTSTNKIHVSREGSAVWLRWIVIRAPAAPTVQRHVTIPVARSTNDDASHSLKFNTKYFKLLPQSNVPKAQ